jgi:1-acyl-sn-glycerol-3-phosphate acyltransferase
LAPQNFVNRAFHLTIRTYLALLKRICGLDYELRSRENIPNHPALFASKQLSAWDSAIVPVLLDDPAVVLRRNLLQLPLYGTIMKRMQHLPISRPATLAEMAQLIDSAKCRIRDGRSVFIFPEGTRMPLRPVQAHEYKRGVVALYKALGVPCVPIALNSGLFWQKRSFIRYPGTIIVEALPPIAPGLGSAEFVSTLGNCIESNSQRLIQETITLHQRHKMQFFVPQTTGGKTASS